MRIALLTSAFVVVSACGPLAEPASDDASDDDVDIDTSGDDEGEDPSMTGGGEASSASAATTNATNAVDDGEDTSPVTSTDEGDGESTDGGAPAGCPDDPHEPNDTPETATPLEINPVESMLCIGDVDEWYFDLDGPSYIEPSLVADPYGMGFQVQVIGPDGATVLEGVLQIDNEHEIQQDIQGHASASGRYVVRVEHFAAEAGPTNYAIQVDRLH